MVRPSIRSTVSVSSVRATLCALGVSVSTAEVLIPALDQLGFVFVDAPPDPVKLIPAESAAALKPDRIEPELRNAAISFDVNVRRFITIAGIKEEPLRAKTKNGRHALAKIGRSDTRLITNDAFALYL